VERHEKTGAWGPRASPTAASAVERGAGWEEVAGLLPHLRGWEADYMWTHFLFGCLLSGWKNKFAMKAGIFHNFL